MNMNKCVWYISKYVSPPSGVSSGSRGFSIMRDLKKMGYNCVIMTSDANHLADVPKLTSSYLVEDLEGVQFCWIKTFKHKVAKSTSRILGWLDFEWKLLRLPKKEFSTPDVIIVSSLSIFTILNGFFLRSRYRCKLVFEIRDIWPLTLTEEGGFSKKNPFVLIIGLIEKLGYKYSDIIVGTMPNLEEHVVNILGTQKETYCIPMGIDANLLEEGEALPKDYIDKYIPKDKFIVGYAGTIGITNALDILFECADSMVDEQNIHFLIVGTGALLQDYKNKYGHLNNLTFAPKVPKTQVQSVLKFCDLLYFSVHVSKVWLYGQSLNKVIDYMLSGKPIVASYTGFPSMINQAGCGSFIPAGDMEGLRKEFLHYATIDRKKREEIGETGRKWILENRSYKQIALEYASILFGE